MKVAEFNKLGDPAEVLTLKEVPSRRPEAAEVCLRVLAAPIHPANLLQIAGQYGTAIEVPAIPGAEGIGEVTEVGSGVDHLVPGQNVLLTGINGTWREDMTVSAAAVTPAPPGDPEQLSMLAVNPVTAHLLLSSFVELQVGDWVIQNAANSAVGEMVTQLAVERGIKTVNVVRRPELLDSYNSEDGAVGLLDGPDLVEQVQAATNGAAIKLAFDSVGGETFERLFASLGQDGAIVSFGNLSGQMPRLDTGRLTTHNIDVRGFWLQKWYQEAKPEDIQAVFGALVPLIASGRIRTKIDSRFPLEEIKDAVTRAAESGRDGKVLLTPQAR